MKQAYSLTSWESRLLTHRLWAFAALAILARSCNSGWNAVALSEGLVDEDPFRGLIDISCSREEDQELSGPVHETSIHPHVGERYSLTDISATDLAVANAPRKVHKNRKPDSSTRSKNASILTHNSHNLGGSAIRSPQVDKPVGTVHLAGNKASPPSTLISPDSASHQMGKTRGPLMNKLFSSARQLGPLSMDAISTSSTDSSAAGVELGSEAESGDMSLDLADALEEDPFVDLFKDMDEGKPPPKKKGNYSPSGDDSSNSGVFDDDFFSGDGKDQHNDKGQNYPLFGLGDILGGSKPSLKKMAKKGLSQALKNVNPLKQLKSGVDKIKGKVKDVFSDSDGAGKDKKSSGGENELMDYRERRRREELATQAEEVSVDSLYKRVKSVCRGLSFLGIGYDSIKGNPLGDPELMGDPGLRMPIMTFHYEQDEEGVSRDMRELQPRGGYCRRFVVCKQSETLSEIATMADYVKELELDASVTCGDSLGMNSFSASTGYKNQAQKTASHKSKTFMLKTYCIRYEAGLSHSDTFNWNFTLAFADAVAGLPDTFEGSENDDEGCTAMKWRENNKDSECVNSNVHQWFNFLEQYGTHYIVRVFSGGKMTHQITVTNAELSKVNKEGRSVKSELKVKFGFISGGASVGAETKDSQTDQSSNLDFNAETLIMGGSVPANPGDPKSFGLWSETVGEYPMPVKIYLKSLRAVLPESKRAGFDRAARFYAEAVAPTKSDLAIAGGKVETIGELLRKGTQVLYSGEPPGFAMCPHHERVMLGFAMTLNFLDEGAIRERAHMKACPPGRDKCDGVDQTRVEGDDARIFTLCGGEPIQDLEEVVAISKSTAVAVCPEGLVIASGFALSLQGGRTGPENTDFIPCRAGLSSCTGIGKLGTQKNMVWIACVDPKTPGIQNLVNVAHVVTGIARRSHHDDGHVLAECPKPLGVAMGFTMELHTRLNRVRDSFHECEDNSPECSQSGKGVADASIFVKADRHALLVFATCAEVPSASPDTASVAHTESGENAEAAEKAG